MAEHTETPAPDSEGVRNNRFAIHTQLEEVAEKPSRLYLTPSHLLQVTVDRMSVVPQTFQVWRVNFSVLGRTSVCVSCGTLGAN